MIADRHRGAVAVGALLLVTLVAGPVAAVPATGPGTVAVAAAADASGDVPAPEVRRAVDDVLSRRAYRNAEPPWWARQAEAARAWAARRLIGLLEAATGTAVGWVVLGLAATGALFVAWRLVRGTRWEATRPLTVVDHERRSATDWDARSRDAERRGDLREAVRTAYRAVIAAYAELGLVAEIDGRTVGEYRRAVAAADPGHADAFGRASDVVEAVLYADRPPSAADLAVVRGAAPAAARRASGAPVGVGS